MKCTECGCLESEFDEVLGERTCKDCGLVLVTEMFEETVHILSEQGEVKYSPDKGRLGSVITGKGSYKFNRFHKNNVMPTHIQTGLFHCYMALTAVVPNMDSFSNPILKERVKSLYIELFNKRLLVSYSYEERASAVVFYALKENRTPRTFKEVCSEFSANRKRVMRLVRKINQHYGNRVNFMTIDPHFMLNSTLGKLKVDNLFKEQSRKVLEQFERILTVNTFTKGSSYYACICWITSNVFLRDVTRKSISSQTGFSEHKIYQQTKRILELVGINSTKELKGIDINRIGE